MYHSRTPSWKRCFFQSKPYFLFFLLRLFFFPSGFAFIFLAFWPHFFLLDTPHPLFPAGSPAVLFQVWGNIPHPFPPCPPILTTSTGLHIYTFLWAILHYLFWRSPRMASNGTPVARTVKDGCAFSDNLQSDYVDKCLIRFLFRYIVESLNYYWTT